MCVRVGDVSSCVVLSVSGALRFAVWGVGIIVVVGASCALVFVRMEREGGFSGRFMGGRLFNLNTLFISVL